jgi:hypothetical protein
LLMITSLVGQQYRTAGRLHTSYCHALTIKGGNDYAFYDRIGSLALGTMGLVADVRDRPTHGDISQRSLQYGTAVACLVSKSYNFVRHAYPF